MKTDAEKYAAVFRAAANASYAHAYREGFGSNGDSREIAKANAAAFDGIAALFEGIAKAERHDAAERDPSKESK